MSNSRSESGGNFVPVPRPARLSIAEINELGDFFKKLIDSSNLRWAIVAAVIASILDIIIHLVWLAARYVFRF